MQANFPRHLVIKQHKVKMASKSSSVNQNARRNKNAAAPSRHRSRVKRIPAGHSAESGPMATGAHQDKLLGSRSTRQTTCLILLVGAISSISPFLSLHLRHRVGLMLFESVVLQLRCSLLSVIVCLFILVSLASFVGLFNNTKFPHDKDVLFQKIYRALMAVFAVTSAIAYLSLVLIVPQVRQSQRMPLATFDCEANLITIENCHQQFALQAGELSYLDAMQELLYDGHIGSERLIEKLNCLKYNNKQLENLEAPTRFLLHNCALVCQPQQRHLNQFSDDLNRNQTTRISPPYDQSIDQTVQVSNSRSQVSLKICFTGEFSGGSSYKQFCVTNLVSSANSKSQQLSKTLTIGQLNSILRQVRPDSDATTSAPEVNEPEPLDDSFETFEAKVSTHLVKPVVQFESHFKNWPQLYPNQDDKPAELGTSTLPPETDSTDDQAGWCKFRPIPPFIINNKPFNDIHCSLEHEYILSTSSGLSTSTSNLQDKIYLKRSRRSQVDHSESSYVSENERCKIQCKVNILYQVQRQVQHSSGKLKDLHYYLPLKPCTVLAGSGDKARTCWYYLIFRTIADSSLALTFIILDLFFTLESIETQRYQMEARQTRLILLLLTISLAPLLSALLLTISIAWHNPTSVTSPTSTEGYLVTIFQDKLWPSIKDFLGRLLVDTPSARKRSPSLSSTTRLMNDTLNMVEENARDISGRSTLLANLLHNDYLIPFLLYSIFMLCFSIKAISLPIIQNTKTLVRVSSTEDLGLAREVSTNQLPSRESQAESGLEVKTSSKNLHEARERKLRLFSLLLFTLFMGYLYNLALSTQTSLTEETLLVQQQYGFNSLKSLNVNSNLWYILISKSSTTALILLLVILLSDEVSSYFSYLSPFKPTSSTSDSIKSLRVRQHEAKLLLHLTVSLLVYSGRFYIISTIDLNSKFRWPIMFVFHICEIFNFPFIWFALSARLHELLQELQVDLKGFGALQNGRVKSLHLFAQATIAFIYFVVGRAAALFMHSIHASLYLYNENIDWFISTFYSNIKPSSYKQSLRNKLSLANSTHISEEYMIQGLVDHQESLFSPLPSEHQTYLYATRLLLKYSAMLSVLVGLALLLRLILVRYQLWSSYNVVDTGTSPRTDTESEHMDERLSLDLKRIQSSRKSDLVVHHPTGRNQERATSPKAKVLFHYETNHRDPTTTSDSTSSVGSYQPSSIGFTYQQPSSVRQISPGEFIIPIEIEDYSDKARSDKARIPQPNLIEKTSKLRSKRVRIFEDCEDWPTTDEEPMQRSGPDQNDKLVGESDQKRIRKNISFAPTATLLGETSGGFEVSDSKRTLKPQTSVTKRVQCASPEPSIDDETMSESSLR